MLFRRFCLLFSVVILLLLSSPSSAFANTPQAVWYEACPTSTTCFAAGAGIAKTTDGGSTWQHETVSTGGETLDGISCPSPTVCVAVGGPNVVLRTTNGGTTWTSQTLTSASTLHAVSCSSTLLCYAVGADNVGGGLVLATQNGNTWAQQPISAAASPLSGLSCPTVTTCVATGMTSSGSDFVAQVLVTHNAGTSWTQAYQFPSSAAGSGTSWSLNHLSCSGTTCMAAGDHQGFGGPGSLVSVTTDGGSHWHNVSIPADMIPVGVRCTTTSTCFIDSDSHIIRTTNAGSSWTTLSIPSSVNDLTGMTCGAPGVCYAFGTNHYLATTNNGAAWIARTHP